MIEHKRLCKEIKKNLFQLDEHELKLIVLHIQSLINKRYMGEEVNLLDIYMKIEHIYNRLEQMDEDLVSVICNRGLQDE